MSDGSDRTGFGRLLRRRREQRGVSQEKLAYRADLSPRHVSFLETGRSSPSRGSVLALSRALDLPLRDRNALLQAAGFAAAYPERELDDPSRSHLRSLFAFLLRRHEPCPAYVVDRRWTVRSHNTAGGRLLRWLTEDEGGLGADGAGGGPAVDGPGGGAVAGENLLRWLFDPARLRDLTVNFGEVGRFLLSRLEQEIALRPDDEPLRELREDLAAYGPLPEAPPSPPGEDDAPALPVHLRKEGRDLRLLSFLMTVGAPRDVALEELRIETFLPADGPSQRLLRGLAEDAGGRRR